jgi:hypothetical protein
LCHKKIFGRRQQGHQETQDTPLDTQNDDELPTNPLLSLLDETPLENMEIYGETPHNSTRSTNKTFF